MEYRTNLRKIGTMIRHYRQLERKSSRRDDFNQSEFLMSSRRHPFFDIQPGFPVCSRGTLLRLEQGNDIREEELYRFFMLKLNLHYAYSPIRERHYGQYIAAFTEIITEGSLNELECLNLPLPCPGNLLYDFYDRLLFALCLFYTEALFPSIGLIEEIVDLWFCVPEKLRPATRIFLLTAHSAHPFYDRVDVEAVMHIHPEHPLDLLCFSAVAAVNARYMVADKILARYDQSLCKGELAKIMRIHLRSFNVMLVHMSKLSSVVFFSRGDHPLEKLISHSTLFLLAKHAVIHRAFEHARIYFKALENCGEPWGVFAAFIARHPYMQGIPDNPKLRCLAVYLDEYGCADPQVRLAFLIKHVLPQLGRREEFLCIYLRFELIDLVRQTQRYKYAYDYLVKSETL